MGGSLVSTVVAERKDGIRVGDSVMIRPEFCRGYEVVTRVLRVMMGI